jgi:DNA-binding transcriptional ArsR family regulator
MDAFETLADPMRRKLVDVLRTGERTVGELVDRVEIEQSGVSRHLRILREAGFVDVRAEGQRRFYSLKPDRFRELDQWIGRYRGLWERRLDALGAALERSKHERKGPK